ncbi:MAG: O-methyltransferase [Clostridiaceae bacterium]|nr:O-methyltransferase [Clostridiaceae bacterium]
MREYARENHVPIVSPETAALLKVLVKLHKPVRILEAGTAIGYSSIVMAQAYPDAVIDTIEIDEDMATIANNNIREVGYENRIRILLGDALEIMQCLTSTFDLIFLDAAKGQYLEYLEHALRLLRPGGLLISDNVLYKGLVACEGTVPHKHRTITVNLREYLNKICNDERLETSVIPIGDGLAVSYKKGDINEKS